MENTLPEQVQPKKRKKWLTVFIIIAVLITVYIIWGFISPLDNKKIPGNILGQALCKSQSVFPLYNCSVRKSTVCTNRGCISTADYDRCIKPAQNTDGSWRSLPAPGCTLPSLQIMDSSWTEPCRFGSYNAGESLEDLGFGSITALKVVGSWNVSMNNSNQSNTNVNSAENVVTYNPPLICDNPVHEYKCNCETVNW